jgi:hypothetical protein
MEMNMFVYRVAKGHDGGVVEESCPVNFKSEFEKTILNELQETQLAKIPYDTNNYIDYIHRELWQCGKLRQGWGIEGLDLTGVLDNKQRRSEWIKNYIVGLKKYWGFDPLDANSGYADKVQPCREAAGRMNMLAEVLLAAKPKDIVFIPKHSFQNHHDNDHFTVCEVADRYYFDLNNLYQDFGHVLPVRNLRTFKYQASSLKAIDFIGPHQKAVSTIKSNYGKYNKFKRFVENYYLPLL